MSNLITIHSVSGREINVDIDARTVAVPSISFVGEIFSMSLAGPAFGLIDKNAPGLPVGTTHYIDTFANGKRGFIALDANNAGIINGAYKQAEIDREQAHQQMIAKKFPGIAEIQKAIDAREDYFDARETAMEDEMNDGVKFPKAPVVTVEAVSNKYPLAFLYLKAKAQSKASNIDKAIAGKKAVEMLEKAENPELITDQVKSILKNWLSDSAAWN
ncbi:MAG: hypothetical protein RBS36_04230 [Thiomicrospira sp.]|jgi:hypothetical protein|nr:hypothetical protein [Thiomicrospira sp.]